jgi:DNA invertase Pin-like site-specific DNA recombinase
MKIIAYCRVSTGKQARSGLGLEAQLAAIKAYAASNHAQIVDMFVEVESGAKARPKLALAIKQARATGVVLVAASLDRFSRRVAEIAAMMEAGIQFRCADMPQASPFELHIRASVAEEERRKIGERTRNALAAAKGRGVSLGTKRRGHRIDYLKGSKRGGQANKLKWQLDQIAGNSQLMLKLQAMREDHTLGEIARKLNEDGETTINGKPFFPMTVKRLLSLLPSVLI